MKVKNLLLMGENSLLIEHVPFQKRLGVHKSKQEVTIVVFLINSCTTICDNHMPLHR